MSKPGTRKGCPNRRKMTKAQIADRAKSYKRQMMKSDYLVERVVSAKCPKCEQKHLVREKVHPAVPVRLRRVYCQTCANVASYTDNENIYSIGYDGR